MIENLGKTCLSIFLLTQVIFTFSSKIDTNMTASWNDNLNHRNSSTINRERTNKTTRTELAAPYNLPYPLASLLSRTGQNDTKINAHHIHSNSEKDFATESITTAVMKQESNEPRAKTYSYYYVGRQVWYIILYYIFYQAVYIVYLQFRSILRHKVFWILLWKVPTNFWLIFRLNIRITIGEVWVFTTSPAEKWLIKFTNFLWNTFKILKIDIYEYKVVPNKEMLKVRLENLMFFFFLNLFFC
jgi:hypothetical protein